MIIAEEIIIFLQDKKSVFMGLKDKRSEKKDFFMFVTLPVHEIAHVVSFVAVKFHFFT